MAFRIRGLSPEPFRHLFGQPDEVLRRHGAERRVVERFPGYPDRIELVDVAPGDSVLLLNYVHQPAATPFRASHAIYVREYADASCDALDDVPAVLRRRMLSLRAFDASHYLIDADLVAGEQLESLIERLFGSSHVAYLHAHYARQGCYAARIDRS